MDTNSSNSAPNDDNDVIDVNDSPPSSNTSRVSKTRPFTNVIHQWYSSKGEDSVCNLCKEKKTGHNSSNLESHLQRKHPKEYKKFLLTKEASEADEHPPVPSKKLKSASNQTILDSFKQIAERKEGFKKGTDKYNKCLRAISVAFAANSFPYSAVECRTVKSLFSTLSNGRMIHGPHRLEVASKVAQLSDEIKEAVRTSLADAKLISITTDLWSRPGYSAAFMGVTCHYFDRKTHQLRRALLACRKIQQPHTAQKIHDVFESVVKEWCLDDSRILRIITDNGSNIECAFK